MYLTVAIYPFNLQQQCLQGSSAALATGLLHVLDKVTCCLPTTQPTAALLHSLLLLATAHTRLVLEKQHSHCKTQTPSGKSIPAAVLC
jgi:hypothetical protein